MNPVAYETIYEGHCRNYVVVRHTARHLLEMAEENETGRLLNLRAAMVFMAFTFEAYLNHVGDEEIPFWEEIEMISWKKKLKLIGKHLNHPFDLSRRPMQGIADLFQFRDYLAHGRTEKLDGHRKITDDLPPYDHAWRVLKHEKLEVNDTQELLNDLEAGIEQINAARPTPDCETWLWNQGLRSASTKPII
jgi:hypothetical protein